MTRTATIPLFPCIFVHLAQDAGQLSPELGPGLGAVRAPRSYLYLEVWTGLGLLTRDGSRGRCDRRRGSERSPQNRPIIAAMCFAPPMKSAMRKCSFGAWRFDPS